MQPKQIPRLLLLLLVCFIHELPAINNTIILAGISHSGETLIQDILTKVLERSSVYYESITCMDLEKTDWNTYTMKSNETIIILQRNPRTRAMALITHEVMHNYKAQDKTIKALAQELVSDYGMAMKINFEPSFNADYYKTMADAYQGYYAFKLQPILSTLRYESLQADLLTTIRNLGIKDIDDETICTIIRESYHKRGVRLNNTMNNVETWSQLIGKEEQTHFNTMMKSVLADFKY